VQMVAPLAVEFALRHNQADGLGPRRRAALWPTIEAGFKDALSTMDRADVPVSREVVGHGRCGAGDSEDSVNLTATRSSPGPVSVCAPSPSDIVAPFVTEGQARRRAFRHRQAVVPRSGGMLPAPVLIVAVVMGSRGREDPYDRAVGVPYPLCEEATVLVYTTLPSQPNAALRCLEGHPVDRGLERARRCWPASAFGPGRASHVS
jgi:hypothetical protein